MRFCQCYELGIVSRKHIFAQALQLHVSNRKCLSVALQQKCKDHFSRYQMQAFPLNQ